MAVLSGSSCPGRTRDCGAADGIARGSRAELYVLYLKGLKHSRALGVHTPTSLASHGASRGGEVTSHVLSVEIDAERSQNARTFRKEAQPGAESGVHGCTATGPAPQYGFKGWRLNPDRNRVETESVFVSCTFNIFFHVTIYDRPTNRPFRSEMIRYCLHVHPPRKNRCNYKSKASTLRTCQPATGFQK